MNMHHFGKEVNPAVKVYSRKVKKSSLAFTPSTPGVLVQSNKHNSQVNNSRKSKCLKQKESKTQYVGNENSVLLNRVSGENAIPSVSPFNAKIGKSDLCSASPNLRTFKDSRECFSRSYVTSRDGYDNFTANRLRTLEDEVFAKTLEINELNRRLKCTHLKMAEMVAQSAISTRDMQQAAIKEIKNAFLKAHNCSCVGSGTAGRFKGLGSGGFVSSKGDPSMQSSLSHSKVVIMQLELKSTRQELADCKLKLADMKRQLENASDEKEKLQCYIRSSLKTSLKLYDTLMNQKAVMQLELLAYQERTLNASAALIQSAKNELEQNQKTLNTSLLTRSGVESTLRDCVELLSRAKDELSSCKQRALSNQEQNLNSPSPTGSGDETAVSNSVEMPRHASDDLSSCNERSLQAEEHHKEHQQLSSLNAPSHTSSEDKSTYCDRVEMRGEKDDLSSFTQLSHQPEYDERLQDLLNEEESLNLPHPRKKGHESTLTDCTGLLRQFHLEEHGKQQHLQTAEQQEVEMDREAVAEFEAQVCFKWTVLYCVWEGAVISSTACSDDACSKCDSVNVKDVTFQRKPKSPLITQYPSSEEITPLKTFNLATPRFSFCQNRLTLMETPVGRGFLHPESFILENLIKSEHEVEILGDKVDELKIVLEKVSSLLDCISNSGISGYKTKELMRKIIEQLQMFGNHDTPVSKIGF